MEIYIFVSILLVVITIANYNESLKGPALSGEQMDEKRKRIVGQFPSRFEYKPSGLFCGQRPLEPSWENFMASILINDRIDPVTGFIGQFLCSGVLISKQHILTALHCIIQDPLEPDPFFSFNNVEIYFDRANLSVWKGKMFKPIEYFYVNKPNPVQFFWIGSEWTPKDDIAVIKLNQTTTYEDRLVAMPLSTPEYQYGILGIPEYPGIRPIKAGYYYIGGWGQSEFNPRWVNPEFLQVTFALEETDCPQSIWNQNTNANMCFKNYNDVAATCPGDSGSPGLVKINHIWHVQGIHKRQDIAPGHLTFFCNETESIQVDSDISVYKDQIDAWIYPTPRGPFGP